MLQLKFPCTESLCIQVSITEKQQDFLTGEVYRCFQNPDETALREYVARVSVMYFGFRAKQDKQGGT